MAKANEAVSIRADADSYKSLFMRGKGYGQTITATLARLIRDEDQRDPVGFTIRRVLTPEGEHYEVRIGSGDSIWSGPTIEAARDALAAYRKKHGLDRRRFPLSPEVITDDLRDPPLIVSEFKSTAA